MSQTWARAVVLAVGKVADAVGWLGLPLAAVGAAGAWAGLYLAQHYRFKPDFAGGGEWGALLLVVSGLLMVAGVLTSAALLRSRLALAQLWRAWAAKRETWKQAYISGLLEADEYRPLVAEIDQLLAGRDNSWTMRHVARMARAVAWGLILAGTMGIAVASARTKDNWCQDSDACKAIDTFATVLSGGLGLAGIALLVAGIVVGVAARARMNHRLEQLTATETRLIDLAHSRSLEHGGRPRRLPGRRTS